MATIRVQTNDVGGMSTFTVNTLNEALDLQRAGLIDRFQFLSLQRDLVAEGANLFAPAPGEQLMAEGPPFGTAVTFPGPGVALSSTMEAGADLRDSGISPGPAGSPGIIGVAALVRLLTPALATRALPVIRQTGPGGTIFWSRLPSWLQTALGSVGAAIGIDLLMDLPDAFEIIPGGILPASLGGGRNGGAIELAAIHIPGDMAAHIVGTWQANGVTFYRLSDGRLAVQNKKGRWKVWRPKRPIVIMPTGAVDLRTMLRADAVLNKQAKRLAAMLNRRAPRSKRSKTMPPEVVIVEQHSKGSRT